MTDRDQEAFKRLLTAAKMLYANAEGCAVNHYGEDFALHGLPGWLADCQTDILAAEAALTHAREAGAQEPVAVPEGWKLVPTEPTPEMIDAWHRASWPTGPSVSPLSQQGLAFVRYYDAMLAAAPASPPADSGEVERLRDADAWAGLLNGGSTVLEEAATAITERDAQIERLEERCAAYKGQVEAGAAEIERLKAEHEDTHRALTLSGKTLTALDQAVVEMHARATTAERDLAEARAEVERKDAALRQIASWEPATQEITVANMMAAEARAALAKGCADGQS